MKYKVILERTLTRACAVEVDAEYAAEAINNALSYKDCVVVWDAPPVETSKRFVRIEVAQ